MRSARILMTLLVGLVFACSASLAKDPPKKSDDKADVKLPGKAKWNFSELEKDFTIVKTTNDEDNRKVILLVEAKKDMGVLRLMYFKFYDADDVKLATTKVQFNPDQSLTKGGKTRVVLDLPSAEIMKEARKVVIEPKF